MASYDYRCRICDTAFEVQRPVTAPVATVVCPGGHDDAARVWSAVAVTGTGRAGAPARAGGGGCCGGGCCGGGTA